MKDFIVFDIDNCVADDKRRQKFIPTDRKNGDWSAYFKDAENDPPVHGAEDLLRLAFENTNATIAFLTARPARYRDLTMGWIEKTFPFLTGEFVLMMRANDTHDPTPELKVKQLAALGAASGAARILMALDDRNDVLDAYVESGFCDCVIPFYPEVDVHFTKARMMGRLVELGICLPCSESLEGTRSAADTLKDMAALYDERNVVYGDAFRVVGRLLDVLHGVDSAAPAVQVLDSPHVDFTIWHLYELLIVKLSRFAQSGLTHRDSIRDLGVYAAMIDTLIGEKHNG